MKVDHPRQPPPPRLPPYPRRPPPPRHARAPSHLLPPASRRWQEEEKQQEQEEQEKGKQQERWYGASESPWVSTHLLGTGRCCYSCCRGRLRLHAHHRPSVRGLGCRVSSLGFRVWGQGLGDSGSRLRTEQAGSQCLGLACLKLREQLTLSKLRVIAEQRGSEPWGLRWE
jgi:hypothetical protein